MVAAVAAHVMFALMLMQPQEPSPASGDGALQVIFIEWRPPPAVEQASVEPPPTVKSNLATAASTSTGIVMEVVTRPTQTPAVAAPGPAPPIPATDADDRWQFPARPRPTTDGEFRRNPLERPSADLLAVPAPERFRMRKERTPEDVLKGVAQLAGLWPPGYTTDPCPEIGRNVSTLSQSSDAASRRQLEVDLERERNNCR
jgi:hypothetical protein